MGMHNILYMMRRGELPAAERNEALATYFAGIFRAVRFGIDEAHGRGAAVQYSYLKEKGYLILEENWRFRQTEIDLIAFRKGVMIFVEVKTRFGELYGQPEDSVNWQKQKFLQRASAAYINLHNFEDELRFDIISITFRSNGSYELYHIEDAFFPGL